jgi:hypothetical protein
MGLHVLAYDLKRTFMIFGVGMAGIGAQPTASATSAKPPLCGINRPSHLVPGVEFDR